MSERIVVRIRNDEEFNRYREWSIHKGYAQLGRDNSYYLNYREGYELCVHSNEKYVGFDSVDYYTAIGRKIISVDEAIGVESHPKFVRGEEVEVSDFEIIRDKRTYVTAIEGSSQPYVCVCQGNEKVFKEGGVFDTKNRKHIRKVQSTGEVKKFTEQYVKSRFKQFFKGSAHEDEVEMTTVFLSEHDMIEG